MTERRGNMREQLLAAVKKELQLTNDTDEAVRRATLRLYKQKRAEGRGNGYTGIDLSHPLAQLLELPNGKRARTTPQDIKRHLTKQDATLFEKALPFAPHLWQQALGENLSSWIKPLGFADRHEQVVLIEVDSAARAHDLSFYKADLLYRIRTIPGLTNVRDFRFRVNANVEQLPDFSSLLNLGRGPRRHR
jgi:hypothetical protein